MSVIFGLLLVGAFLVWLRSPGTRRGASDEDGVDSVDADELEAAEREVRDLGVDQRPEDGFEGDDWGPGAGRHRGNRR